MGSLPKLAGSWLLYRLPSSVRPARLQQLGGSGPLRLGAQEVAHEGPLLVKTVWILPMDPQRVSSPPFSQCFWGLCFHRLAGFRLSQSCCREPKAAGTLKMRLSGTARVPRSVSVGRFSGNPVVPGLLRAGTAIAFIFDCIHYISRSFPCSGLSGMVLSVGIYVWTVQPRLRGSHLVWDEACTMPDIIFVNLFVCFFKEGPWFVSSGSKN